MQRSNIRQILVIFLIGFLPILLAYLVYVGYLNFGWSAKNHGYLINPSVKISMFDENQKWLWVYFASSDCDFVCKNRLMEMKQAHMALGKYSDQVERIYLSSNLGRDEKKFLKRTYPFLKYVGFNKKTFSEHFLVDEKILKSGFIFLVDPDRYVFLYYDLMHNGYDLLKDSKFLLSHR